ncbi:MAG: ABC transporter ATP-binding protein [Pseudomonadota bacterium]
MIEIENLSKSFGQFVAVQDLSFNVAPGEVLGFLGPNGAGKSTTMKMITGFLKPDSGRISVYGHSIQSESQELRRIIGYLPEGAPAWGEMTVQSFLEFIADIRQLAGAEKSQRIESVIEQLQLDSVLQRPIEHLSKGFRRRVGIAQAIVHDPRVLILDEPTDGLDPNQKHQVRELIRNLATDKIVIVSTHILEEVNAVCSRALIIANGMLVADSTPSDLERQSRYYNAITIELDNDADIGAVLRGAPEVAAVESAPGQPRRFTVFPNDANNIYALVNEAAQKHQWPVSALHIERGRLDDVFRELTEAIHNPSARVPT